MFTQPKLQKLNNVVEIYIQLFDPFDYANDMIVLEGNAAVKCTQNNTRGENEEYDWKPTHSVYTKGDISFIDFIKREVVT